MSEPKHTPGPWSVFNGPFPGVEARSKSVVIYGTDDETEHGIQGKDRTEREANARLIAAAPELLQALIAITDQLDRVGDSRKDAPFINAAREVIAKAEGVSK